MHSNTLKHAAASSIRITGELIQGKFYLQVQDNGKGFDFDVVQKKPTPHLAFSIFRKEPGF
ncbi:MAG: hypothetical protein IPH36_20215 [Saprospiraceae bacterium]|nr:hypothetical protein [Saprospiraceae bacterium]